MITEYGIEQNYYYAILPNMIGHYCGYVFIPNDHSRGNENMYEDIGNMRAHGGITYEESYLRDIPWKLPAGRWIGFDCAHSGDAQDPEYLRDHPESSISHVGDIFRDRNYVFNEIKDIIEQLGSYDTIIQAEPLDFKLELPY